MAFIDKVKVCFCSMMIFCGCLVMVASGLTLRQAKAGSWSCCSLPLDETWKKKTWDRAPPSSTVFTPIKTHDVLHPAYINNVKIVSRMNSRDNKGYSYSVQLAL